MAFRRSSIGCQKLSRQSRRAIPIFIVEGEGKADALREIGVAATTNLMAPANGSPTLTNTCAAPMSYLLPDNDEPGWKHINDIGASLVGIAARTRVVRCPVCRRKATEQLACGWRYTRTARRPGRDSTGMAAASGSAGRSRQGRAEDKAKAEG